MCRKVKKWCWKELSKDGCDFHVEFRHEGGGGKANVWMRSSWPEICHYYEYCSPNLP